LYNGILAILVLIWLLGFRSKRTGGIVAFLRRYGTPITVLLWVLFVAFGAWYILNFSYFEEIHDIDDAVDMAVGSVVDGTNPYEEFVVPRFKGKYSPVVEWTFGPYNYMPLDLVTYVGANSVLGWLGSPEWFVVTNLVFSGIAMYLLRNLTRVSLISFVPIAGTAMLFYSMDNASLTLMLMVLSLWALDSKHKYSSEMAIFVMGLATLTKVYAGLPLAVMFLFEAEKRFRKPDWACVKRLALTVCAVVVIAAVLMLPFGVNHVLEAAVFFHASEESRVGTSIGGTLLSEMAPGSDLFVYIAVAVVLSALIGSFLLPNMNDRVMLVMISFLLVVVKSSLAPLTVPGIFLAIRLREIADERAVANLVGEDSGGIVRNSESAHHVRPADSGVK